MDTANDNSRERKLPTSFREKVISYYEQTGVMHGSASFIATYYLAAVQRMKRLDMNAGPILPGCEQFGPEPSPRRIVEAHARRTGCRDGGLTLAQLVERGVAAAADEITRPSTDAFGYRRGLCSPVLSNY